MKAFGPTSVGQEKSGGAREDQELAQPGGGSASGESLGATEREIQPRVSPQMDVGGVNTARCSLEADRHRTQQPPPLG